MIAKLLAELMALHQILEPIRHRADHSYNKWSMTRDRKNTLSYIEAMEYLAKDEFPAPVKDPRDFPISQLRRINVCTKASVHPSIYMMHESEVDAFVAACVKRFETGDTPSLWIITEGKLGLDAKSSWWSSPTLEENDPLAAKLNDYFPYKRLWAHPDVVAREKNTNTVVSAGSRSSDYEVPASDPGACRRYSDAKPRDEAQDILNEAQGSAGPAAEAYWKEKNHGDDVAAPSFSDIAKCTNCDGKTWVLERRSPPHSDARVVCPKCIPVSAERLNTATHPKDLFGTSLSVIPAKREHPTRTDLQRDIVKEEEDAPIGVH
jgi:hypothetical protein